MARRSTARGPARSDRTESVCPLHGRRLFARPLARGRADCTADDVSRPGARSVRRACVHCTVGGCSSPLAKGRADCTADDVSRPGARSVRRACVHCTVGGCSRVLSPKGAPIARQTTFRGPARSNRRACVHCTVGDCSRAPARGRADCMADDVLRPGAHSVRRTRAVRRVRTVRSGAGSPRSLARRPRKGIYLSHSVNSTSRTGAPTSSGMKID